MSRAFAFALLGLGGVCLSVSCGSEIPTRACSTAVWARPARASAEVTLLGSWSDYAEPIVLPRYGDGWRMTRLVLPPGEFGYFLVEDGEKKLDPFNALSTFRGDEEVSLLLVPDCHTPALELEAAAVSGDEVTVRGRFLAANDGAPLDEEGLSARIEGGPALEAVEVDPDTGRFVLRAAGLSRGRHPIVVEARDEDGLVATAKLAAWVLPAQRSFREGLIYQLVLDRFRGDGGVALAPPSTPTERAGGTLGGVLSELERGSFEALGVTTLWLSPVYVNPDEPRDGRDGHPSTAYHGYWPEQPLGVDPRLGGDAALHALVDAAHARGIRVLLDLVPNHVYETHPRFVEHRGAGWFNDGPEQCVCGSAGCSWATDIQSCWFAPYLPDVRWQNPESLHAALGDTLTWAETFRVDGFRIDAVPMMPRAVTRRLAHTLRTEAGLRDDLFLIGEVFTGSGQAGIDDIRYFLGPDGLDGAFDFPMMWALRDVVAHGGSSFRALEDVLVASEESYRGSGATRGLFLGNHDTTRFLSEANGDAAGDPWTAPPAVPTDASVFARHRLGLGLVFTLGEMPVLYYGDELGLAGGSDPDCRRVLPADDALSSEQAATLAFTRRLGSLRRCSEALRAGSRVPLVAEGDHFAFSRVLPDGTGALVVASRAASATTVELPATGLGPGLYADALSGEKVTLATGGTTLSMPPRSLRILLPDASPCLAPL